MVTARLSRRDWPVMQAIDLVGAIDRSTDHLDRRPNLLLRRQPPPSSYSLFQGRIVSLRPSSTVERRRLPTINIDFVILTHSRPHARRIEPLSPSQRKIYRGVASLSGMGRSIDLILGMMAATATALLLALISRDAIGMPPDMVREDALTAASIVIVAIASMPFRRRKR
jgi:hypothetical protein